jgi:hypothetical protein
VIGPHLGFEYSQVKGGSVAPPKEWLDILHFIQQKEGRNRLDFQHTETKSFPS